MLGHFFPLFIIKNIAGFYLISTIDINGVSKIIDEKYFLTKKQSQIISLLIINSLISSKVYSSGLFT